MYDEDVISDNALNDGELTDGMRKLVKGYIEYAAETIQQRAIPGIDGFKPVNRRILHTMKLQRAKDFTKCANIVGATMKFHPHGDGSIYEALVKMTTSAECLNVPFIVGKGSFGKVYDECGAAASRYTECKLHPITEEIFKDMDGAKMVLNYDDTLEEPALLPVPFPSILCNGSMGIAVGIATSIAMFNFNEVNNAAIEIIENGKLINYLVPDYPTGGTYVMSRKDIIALNETGKAVIKLRGKWYIDGNKIIIKEIPYYTTVEAIIKEAKKISGVANVNDSSDITGMEIEITCTSKRNVDYVLAEVLKKTNLQMTKTTNTIVINNNTPCIVGVEEMLKMWIEFRTGVLSKKLNLELEATNRTIKNYEYLVRLFENKEWTDKFLDANRESENKAKVYLKSIFEDIDEEAMDYITSQTFKSISNIGKRKSQLNNMYAGRDEILKDLSDIPAVIVRQLKELNRKYPMPRKTEISDFDYKFNEDTDKIKPQPVPVIVQIDGKFIKKIRDVGYTGDIKGIRCNSDDAIACIDNKGRIIRVYLENVDFNSKEERGTYIPVYLGEEDNFEIIINDIVSNHEGCYMYSDGYVSVVDYNEWYNIQKRTKVTERGISPRTDLLVGEVDINKPYIFVMTKNKRIGILTNDFKHKHRTARTKLVSVPAGDEITHCVSLSDMEVLSIIDNSGNYMNKLIKAKDRVNFEMLNKIIEVDAKENMSR